MNRRRSATSYSHVRNREDSVFTTFFESEYEKSRGIIRRSDFYHLLERQEGHLSFAYHFIVFLISLTSLVLGSLSTINELVSKINEPLYWTELVFYLFFFCEFVIRVWSAGCVTQYRSFTGRLMFLKRPMVVLDILTLIGFGIAIFSGSKYAVFPPITLKLLPLLQMIRFFRVDRQLFSWKILKEIIMQHQQELTASIYLEASTVFIQLE
ncbi:unnamed protein product [Didymodactylos carnosus]|uniref:Ion transport domain-containing protein n=1 Tax=Didymodactylos carnosus TaxID=1234261 RepID=A0A813U219_9BILA|nr:unnamed protein product [Didymodactylos carnosus]CAF3608074.1 unnamed protein product [Didymodactylos carnosus]